MKVAIPLAKNILVPLGITATASAIDAGIKKKPWFSNNDFNNFKRRNEWHNENYSSSWRFSYFPVRITEIIKNETKEQKRWFLGKILGTFGASLLGNMSAVKGIVRAGFGNKKGKGIVRAGSANEMGF